jgi:hypothetical protein
LVFEHHSIVFYDEEGVNARHNNFLARVSRVYRSLRLQLLRLLSLRLRRGLGHWCDRWLLGEVEAEAAAEAEAGAEAVAAAWAAAEAVAAAWAETVGEAEVAAETAIGVEAVDTAVAEVAAVAAAPLALARWMSRRCWCRLRSHPQRSTQRPG